MYEGFIMSNSTDIETEVITDTSESHHLLLDGTVHLDYADEDQVPRIRGLIEILEHFLGARD